MAKFQLTKGKARDVDGNIIPVGTMYEAENAKDFANKYPSLVGKVERLLEEPKLEVATPKKTAKK